MKLLWFLSLVGYLVGVFLYVYNRKHFLFLLLSLEFMVLSIFLLIMLVMYLGSMNMFFTLIYLTMAVCEGVLGLSVMVMMIRMRGNDLIMNLSMLW